MTSNNSTNYNMLKPQRLMNLTSLIIPEKDKSFEYLCKFFKYSKVENLKIISKITIEDLLKQEKIYHDMILNPSEHNVSRLNSWLNYILWIKKLFTKDDLRFFLVLENFTKSTTNEKEYFTQSEFVEQWITYVDMCADDIEVMKYMKRNEICTKHNFFYQSMAILYEKSHDFQNANLAFLDGFDKKVENLEYLQVSYKLFEERMENRINREINSTVFSSEVINNYIHNELKKITQNLHDSAMYNSNNKRLRNFSANDSLSYLNFVIKKKKIEFHEDNNTANNALVNQEGINSTIKYGQIPIYVDEPFRKNVITKGSKLVEIHTLIIKFLSEKDEMFKIQNQNFLKKLKDDYNKKPVSWLNGLRINPEKILPGEGVMPLIGNLEIIRDKEKINNINKAVSNINNNNNIVNEKQRVDKIDLVGNDNESKELKEKKMENEKNNKKVEDVMNKMINEITQKSETIDVDLKKNDKTIQNLEQKQVKNSNPDSVFTNKNEKKPVDPVVPKELPSKHGETIQLQDGNKYKILRVENQGKKEMEIIMMKQKTFNENKKEYFTLEHIRSQFYFEKLRRKEKKELELKNKRKTIVFKFDSDGDMCLSSDEEKEMSPKKEDKAKIIEQDQKKINLHNEKKSDDAITNQIISQQIQQFDLNNNIGVSNNHKKIKSNPPQNLNLNLFDYAMTIEEINEKIKEVTKMFTKGLINIDTRNLLYSHLEEKIIQIEKLEKEQQSSKNLKKLNSFNELKSEDNSKSSTNPFLNQNKLQNKSEKIDQDFFTYLEPINYKIQNNMVNPNQNKIQNNRNNNIINNNIHVNPLMELPHSIIKKTADETVFSNVSRSLDFTNIKLIDSSVKNNENKIPFSSLFINENKNKSKKEEFSVSFDSDHSYMFPNPFDTTPIKEEIFFSDLTPSKETPKNLQKSLKNRDTPLLVKKAYIEEDLKIKEDSKIHSINHINHINFQLISNNNSLKVNEDKNFPDLNNILKEGNKKMLHSVITDSEEDNESEVEKKMKLAKLFGDAFGMGKKQEPPINFAYGLSSITEKTTENTYLSDDSVILRKII